jgi:hypothetical protein
MSASVEIVGYLGSACAIAADGMREMMPLRIAAVLSSVLFLVYGGLIGSVPMMLMEAILLPVNGLRLAQLLRSRTASASARLHEGR